MAQCGRDGFRAGDAPVATFTADDAGAWGPLTVSPGVYYEIYVEPPPEFPAYTGGDECPEIVEGTNTGTPVCLYEES